MAPMATHIPLDVLAAIFIHDSMGLRDVGAARLVCRHWRAAVDGVTVRRLAIRSPGPANCTLLLLRRFPLLQSLCLGSAVTSSNRTAFSAALSSVQALSGQLTRLSLEFACAPAVHLPTCLHSLTRLRTLTVSVGTWQPVLGQGLTPQGPGRLGTPLGAVVAAAKVAAWAGTSADGGRLSVAVNDPTDDGDDAVILDYSGGYGSGSGSLRELSVPGRGYGVGSGGLSGGGDGRSTVPVRVPPAGLIPFLSVLGCLTFLELVHITISVPEVLGAVQSAATAPAAARTRAAARAGQGLRRLVLVGSCVNLTGVDAPAAAAQLAGLEVLCVDGCTGADALMPLLPYLTALKRLDLAGMDYTWAAAAGYHRRAGFNSANDLMQHVNNLNNGNQIPNHHVNAHGHNGVAVGVVGVGNAGLIDNVDEGDGGGAAATAAASALAAAAGRPLWFLSCLPRLQSLNLAGSFLRTLPNRDISGLTGLMELDLSGNGIDDLPPGLTLLPLLRRLDVAHNELLALPSWMAQMQSLECISCHHNSLERFPTLLYELTRLSHLVVGHNRISWWPVECVLPRHRPPPLGAGGTPPPQHPRLPLVSLDLSHNRLFGLPGGLAWLAALRCLRLRDSLAGLDQSGTARAMALLAGLTGLRELDISSNHLDQHSIVPLSELRDLRRLWLADNGLEELPLGLAQLSCLTLLSLRANRFTEVPVCLRWLSCLEVLDLSCNRLAELPPWISANNASHTSHVSHTSGNTNTHASRADRNTGASNTSASGANTSTAKSDTFAADTDASTTNIDAGVAVAASGAHPPPANLHQHHYQHPRPSHHPYKVGKPLGKQLHFRVTPPIRQQLQQQQQQQQVQHEHTRQHEDQHRHRHQQQGETHSEGKTDNPTRKQRYQHQQVLQHDGQHLQDSHPTDQRSQQVHGKQGHGSPAGHSQLGLVGLRHLDVSQQYSIVVRESAVPDIPPRLEVQPPHCLYGPLQGDLPEELLWLPHLRTLVLQRHMLRMGSRVLSRLQKRGVEVIHPRPLRVESLPGAAAAALNTAAAAGGLLFPGHHPELRAIAQAAIAGGGGGGGGGGDFLLGGGGIVPAVVHRRTASFLGPRGSFLLLSLVVLTPMAVAIAASALGLPPPPHVVMIVVVAAATRLALSAILLSREAQRRRQRHRNVGAAAIAAAVQPLNGGGGAAAGH